MQMPDSQDLQALAATYHISTSLFDCGVMALILGIITTIRFVLRRKRPNFNPSGFWYIPKVLGMLLVITFGPVHFIAEGAFVDRVSDTHFWLVVMSVASAGILFWAYSVIWKPVVRKAVR